MRQHDFEDVLKLFEAEGWKLVRIQEEYRIFKDFKGSDPLPWPIPVIDKKVDDYYVQQFKKYVKDKKKRPEDPG
jgi:hypothetical protein